MVTSWFCGDCAGAGMDSRAVNQLARPDGDSLELAPMALLFESL